MLSFLPCYILQNINPTTGVPHFQSLALGATSKTYQILGHKTLCEHLKICPDGVKLYLMVKELDIWTENKTEKKCGSSLYGQRIWRKLGFQSAASKKSEISLNGSSSNKQQEAEPVAPDFNVFPQYKCTSPSYSVQDSN